MAVTDKVFKSQPGKKRVPGVKRIVAVGSGKGGVGKSTCTSNLALALRQQGLSVGVLDADIYGPNQGLMLGVADKALKQEGGLLPILLHGLQTMSIAYLIEDDTPMVWRGPMLSKVMEQLLCDTKWQDLDVLLIDLPPGTGDIQLSLAKKFHGVSAVMVTTPQPVACLDTKKAIRMFEKVDVPIIGIVENMSHHVCGACGHEDPIFGVGGGEALAKACDLELLGQIPLNGSIREASDLGEPAILKDPNLQAIFTNIAQRIIASQSPSDHVEFPDIVVE